MTGLLKTRSVSKVQMTHHIFSLRATAQTIDVVYGLETGRKRAANSSLCSSHSGPREAALIMGLSVVM